MAKKVEEEDLGESWEMYKKALGTDDAEPDGQGSRLPVPGEGEQISPSPTPEEEPSAKNHSKKSRRKSVSKKVSVPMEKCDARLTVLFPDAVIGGCQIGIVFIHCNGTGELIKRNAVGSDRGRKRDAFLVQFQTRLHRNLC